MAGRNIKVEVLGDASGLSRALGSASTSAGSFGKRIGSAGLGLARFGQTAALVAGGAALGGLALTLRAGIKEWSEHAKVAAQTNAVLRSTGGVANVTRQHVEDLANAMLQKTGIDDEQIQTTANLLLGYTNIRNELGKGNDVFDRATRLVTDYTVRTGKAAPAAVAVFGKALNDLGEGKIPTTLRGIGKLNDGLVKQMTAMVKAGDVAGAQGVLLGTLEKRYQGAAEAAGNTLPGQLNKLRENFNNFAGDIAKTFGPAFSTALSAASGFLQKLSAAQGFRAKLNVVWEGASGAATSAFNALKSALAGVKWSELWASVRLNAQAFAERINTAIGDVKWDEVGRTLGEAVSKGISFGSDLSKKLTEELVRAARNIDWAQVGKGFIEGFTGSGGIPSRLKTAMGKIWEFDKMTMLGPSLRVGELTANAIVGGFTGAGIGEKLQKAFVTDTTAKLNEAIAKMKDNVIPTASMAGTQIGSTIAASAAAGIRASLWAMAQAAIDVVLGAVALAGARLHGSGPWQFTIHAIGEPMGHGVGIGFASGVMQSVPRMVAAVNAAATKIAETRAAFVSAFTSIANDALAAFDAKMAAWVPPSQRMLDKLRADMAKADVENAVKDAQAAAQAAQQAFDTATQQEGESDEDFLKRKQDLYAQILDADRALKDAQRALIEYNLEQQAAAEQAAHDKQAKRQRESLAKQLYNLEQFLLKHPEAWKQSGDMVLAVLDSYGVKLGEAGQRWASKFSGGLATGLAQLQAALAAFLRASGVDTGPPAGSSGGGGGGGPTDAGRRGGGRGTGLVVNVTVQGALLGSSVQQVAETIKREFINEYNANGPLGFYPAPS